MTADTIHAAVEIVGRIFKVQFDKTPDEPAGAVFLYCCSIVKSCPFYSHLHERLDDKRFRERVWRSVIATYNARRMLIYADPPNNWRH